jgi:predicted nuclease of predicted toxin-antitoxin system
MKFIVDAQLPRPLAVWLKNKGFEAIHTLDLPQQNLTDDMDIIKLSMVNQYIVISKDSDFFDYYVLKQQPHKLILLTTGNIVNKKLIQLFEDNFEQLVQFIENNQVVEMSNFNITVHF